MNPYSEQLKKLGEKEMSSKELEAKKPEHKRAIVYKDRSGYWVAEDVCTNEKLNGFHDSELQAYKAANARGYIVC